MKRRDVRAIVAALLAVFGCQAVLAQQEHDHEHGKPAEFKMPTSYQAAVKEIERRLVQIDKLIKAKQLDKVHAQADVIKQVGNQIGQLALEPDSGVPKDAVKEVNQAGRALAGKFDAIDKVADGGDLAGTQREYDEMVKLTASLSRYTPKIYQCPMKCEGDKTYEKPGECPKCNMHLKQITDEKFSVEVTPSKGLKPGVETTLKFHLKDPAGKTVKNLQVVHEKILHLLMASEDLSWYAHEHPEIGADGTFTLKWAFPRPGKYVLYHDFTPEGVGMQVVPVDIMVDGTPPARVALRADGDTPKTVDGFTVQFKTDGKLAAETEEELTFSLSKDGKPVTDLEPYLGAMGHLVIISQDLKEFVHSHPLEEGPSASKGPNVVFHAHFPAAGLYKGWGQFQHKGKIITVPFTFEVSGANASAGGESGHGHGSKP